METEAEMVNKRSAELLDEFLEHWRQAQELEGHAVNREEACCGWLLQKVAGLQVAVEMLMRGKVRP